MITYKCGDINLRGVRLRDYFKCGDINLRGAILRDYLQMW